MIHTETDDGYPINIPYSFCGYKLLNILGFGSTSIVCLVEEEETCLLYSAKIIPKRYIEEKNLTDQIQKEIAVMGEVDHPNIVKLYRSFELRNRIDESYLVLIMEYCENGDLLSYATEKGFNSEYEKYKIFKGFLEAIKYLHKRGISHGDIKPENILIDSDLNAKLADFGYCRTTLFAGDDSKFGTLYYASPELFVNGEFDTLKSDIWSIGITLYCISESSFPYKNGNSKFIIEQIISGSLRLSPTISESLKNVVVKCTDLKPENRPTIEELMKYDYFSVYDDLSKRINPDFNGSFSTDDSEFSDKCGFKSSDSLDY